MADAITTLLLIRHATNDYVAAGRLAGWTPGVHLNAQGQGQADALARRLANVPIHAIYSSPLERTVETAQAVAQCQKLDVQIVQELGEGRAGDWTGKYVKDLEQTEAWKQMQAHPVGFHLPGGESIDEVQARLVAAINQLLAKHRGHTIAVVSHADPIKSVVAHYLGMDLNDFNRIVIDPASTTAFVFNERGPMLVRLNDSEKLPAALKPPQKKSEEQTDERKEKTDHA